jgi:DNA-binding IclR family transcriptional regulator
MSQSPAQFAVRTLRALEVLTFAPATAAELAEALGVHPRVAGRLLSQLQRDGWLSYSGHSPRIYAPTLRFVALAAHIAARAPLVTITSPAVQGLHAATDIPAALSIPGYDATVCTIRSCGERAM